MGQQLGPLGEGELGPHLTQCYQGRGLPACQISSLSIQPFGHSTPTLQTDRQYRQRDNGLVALGEPFYKRSRKNYNVSVTVDSNIFSFVMAVLCNMAGHYIFARGFFFYLLFFPRLISAAADWILPYFLRWCGLSANLRCRSETCCTRLAESTGRKKSPKIRHLGTIAQLCRAISLQLRHISTIGKTR